MNKAVIVSLACGAENIRVGKLWFYTRKYKESASFEYDSKWLSHPEKFALEPALKLTAGSFHTKTGRSLFGAIGDSTPDRWGRALLQRARTVQAKANNIIPTTLSEIDYLLSVSDEARQGALRFSLPAKEVVFLSPNNVAIPSLMYLPKLLAATEHFIENNINAVDLKLLLAPGSSLGGARPKASVRELDGSLAIAKFPKKNDEFNTVRWEAVALTLAKNAGIKVPSWRLVTISERSVLIVKRFDRTGSYRIPFLSAMSMLDAQDNEQHSYLEMAYALAQHGASPTEDMEQLWRRIVFTVMISNTDDHLRNHAFIYERYKGWRLSPAYDINPTPIHIKPKILTTAIDFTNTTASLEIAMEVAKEFRLAKNRADEIIKEVSSAVQKWRQAAANLGLTKVECDYMASAFNQPL